VEIHLVTEERMETALSRRQFLTGTGATILALSLAKLQFAGAADQAGTQAQSVKEVAYRSWEDVYRREWTWDKVIKGTHLRANCVSACSWNVYVKDGIVWREEQNAVYAQTNAEVPDFNPRGCQKGGCYSALMYAPSRVKYPLKRAGERGSGKWTRVSWDEALGGIADKIIDVCVKDGPEGLVYDNGTTNLDMGVDLAGEVSLFNLLGATQIDSWAGVGDLPMGAIQTWGMYNVDGTADDWFYSDYILLWLMNFQYTRIPECHFIWEARYRGAKVVSVAPDFNATSIHADLWLNPRVATDAALALAMAHVIVTEKLYKEDYVKEQTDLPFLVREDTRRFLRHADLAKGGSEDLLYVWDAKDGTAVQAPGTQGHGSQTLKLGALDPALEGGFEVRSYDGKTVRVRPVFEFLKERLATLTPEAAAEVSGVSAAAIRQVAREFARAKAGLILCGLGPCKHYHGDLFLRSMILLAALTGNHGKRGGGVRISAWWTVTEVEKWAFGINPGVFQRLATLIHRPTARESEQFFIAEAAKRPFSPLLPFLYAHAGGAGVAGRQEFNDPGLKRPFEEYVGEAQEKGWLRVHPKPGTDPKIYFFTGPNPLRRWPAPQVALKHLWPKLDLIVNANFRVCTTGLYSDYILPAAGYYEKASIKYTMSYLPYVVIGDKAVEPLGESKSEWEMFGLLAKKIQERAHQRGTGKYRDAFGNERDLQDIYERWTLKGTFNESDVEKPLDHIIKNSACSRGYTWSEVRAKGAVPITDIGEVVPTNAICSDYQPGNTVYPSAWFIEKKEPWPTLTGRQQFYIDHPWYLELGEELPLHKEPPAAGGHYPLRMTGGHTRWSIHAIWRDERRLLQLQRGEPVMYMNVADAQRRGIADHDRVRVSNDVGGFIIRVKISPAVQPGQVIVYHAWESYQFEGWKGMQEPVASPWKPLHLAGDYGQLHYRMYYAAPSHGPRGTAVDVQKV
jgi:DMSO reductase family type II enzyme molybdopterin subunit